VRRRKRPAADWPASFIEVYKIKKGRLRPPFSSLAQHFLQESVIAWVTVSVPRTFQVTSSGENAPDPPNGYDRPFTIDRADLEAGLGSVAQL
jgi:hypothetical protein